MHTAYSVGDRAIRPSTSITKALSPSTWTRQLPSSDPPGERPGECPCEPPGELPTEPPGEPPSEPPAEPPGDVPGKPPDELPGEPPGECPGLPQRRRPHQGDRSVSGRVWTTMVGRSVGVSISAKTHTPPNMPAR